MRQRTLRTLGVAAIAAVGSVLALPQAVAAQPEGPIVAESAPNAVQDSYIVVLKPGSAAAASVTSASHALARRYGGEVRRNYISTIRGFNAELSAMAARRLAADPSVAYVEQDRIVRLWSAQTNPTWGLDRIDQRALPLSGSYTPQSAANVTACCSAIATSK